VIPFLKSDYFQDSSERIVFDSIYNFIDTYNDLPTKEALSIGIENLTTVKQSELDMIHNLLDDVFKEVESTNEEWLIEHTEKFCQDRSIYNAIMESIKIIDNDSDKDKGAIPDILSDALSVSFDTHIGHDYLEDSDERYDFYHKRENHISFDLEYFNKITDGGICDKTLNVLMAGPGVGKTLAMCHFAASYLSQGKNVLYITLEMAEERISERIDANLLNVGLQDLKDLPKESYDKKVERVRSGTNGKLIVKEYPTAQAGVSHFRHLLNELNLKKNFQPDVLIIDYINICISNRVKPGGNVNSYAYIKSIAEELRGFAVERTIPIITATQINREGFSSSDVGMENVAESFGLPATADLFLALITSEELEQLNQIMVKQLKNRYSDLATNRRFVVGVDRAKMRLYDCDDSAQEDIMNDSALSGSNDKRDYSEIKV